MKTLAIITVAGIGLVMAGCSSQATPATNNLNTIAPIPETTASLVPGPNHSYGIGGSVGAQSNPTVGGSVGVEGK